MLLNLSHSTILLISKKFPTITFPVSCFLAVQASIAFSVWLLALALVSLRFAFVELTFSSLLTFTFVRFGLSAWLAFALVLNHIYFHRLRTVVRLSSCDSKFSMNPL